MADLRSIEQIRTALRTGHTTVPSLVKDYLDRIEANSHLNAYLEVYGEEAMARAEEIQQKLSDGSAGKLAGCVVAIKDNICYADHKVSASSKILEGYVSPFSSTAVERLLAEDAIIIGRTNCDEFAMGSSNENSAYGPVKNPVDEKTVPGGSSGGSAAVVAANLCTVSLGSDTGGSVRQPASFTGLVGMKPTYGRVSRHGLLAYASSFDQISPFTHNVDDMWEILSVISGTDQWDASMSRTHAIGSAEEAPEGLKIAVLRDAIEREGLNPEIKAGVEKATEELRSRGHEVEYVDFGMLDHLVPCYYILTTAEASSNLSRYDGMHYGHRSKDAKGVDDTYSKSRSEGFGPEVVRRIMLGTFVLSHGYYDAYYTKAQKVRRIIRQRTDEIFSKYDILLSPTTADVAFETGAISDPIAMYLQDLFTVHAPLAGNPAISLPLGSNPNGLPFGIQFMAGRNQDEKLLAFSKYFEELHSEAPVGA